RGLEDLLVAAGDSKRIKPVVIAGADDTTVPGYARGLRQRAGSDVIWTGPLTDPEMAWCYDNCSTFVMTSRVEACPNVGLEALSHGCIVVSADNPPLPEIFGVAAVYYQARVPSSLTSQLESVVAWQTLQRDHMSATAKARASQ